MALGYGNKYFGSGSGGGGVGSSANTQVLFNSAGAVAGDSGLTYDAATDTLTVAANITSPRHQVTNVGEWTDAFGNGGLFMNNAASVNWATSYATRNTPDLGLARSAAGVLKVTDGGAGYGKILVADGTAAAPSVARAAASGTGLFFNTDGVNISPVGTASIVTFADRAFYDAGGIFKFLMSGAYGLTFTRGAMFGFGASVSTPDSVVTSPAAATLQLGAADANNTAVAQNLKVQSNITGTDLAAPAAFTVTGPLGTGTGTAGSIVFKTGVPQASGTTAHVPATALTLTNAGTAGTSAPQVLIPVGAATNPSLAFAGFPTTGFVKGASYDNAAWTSGSVAWAKLVAQAGGVAGFSTYLSGSYSWDSGTGGDVATIRTSLTSPATATLQLGQAASATPVAQTLQAQGGSGTDIAGATPFKIAASKGTGAGTPGSIVLQTSVRGTTGTTVQTASDRFYVSGNEKTLTLGSNTNFVRVDFPASSTITVGIEYNVSVYDTAAPPEFKAHGGRYGVSAYRKSTGNAVAGTVVETLESAVQSVGNAMTDSFTVTGDANGILIGTNVTVGSGLTGSPVGTLRYTVSVNGSGAATVTPQ